MAQPGPRVRATTTWRTRRASVEVAAARLRARAADRLGPDGRERRDRAGPSWCRSWARSSNATTWATTSPCTTRACAEHTAAMLREVHARGRRAGCTDDADVVVVAFGTPGAYVRAAVRILREEGVRVGWSRPVTLVPVSLRRRSPTPRRRAKAVAVYENNTGQMVDDVRLAVLGARTGRVHRRPEPGQLGLRHRPRPRRRPCCAGGSSTWWSVTGERGRRRDADRAHRRAPERAGPAGRRLHPGAGRRRAPITCAPGAASRSPSAA